MSPSEHFIFRIVYYVSVSYLMNIFPILSDLLNFWSLTVWIYSYLILYNMDIFISKIPKRMDILPERLILSKSKDMLKILVLISVLINQN